MRVDYVQLEDSFSGCQREESQLFGDQGAGNKLALEPLGDGERRERPVRDPLDYVSPDGIVTQEAM